MIAIKQSFDKRSHEQLIDILAKTDYTERYFTLCADFPVHRNLDGPRLDLARTADIFRSSGTLVQFDKRFKVFTFDRHEAVGWSWQAKLVVQRYDRLEPMFEADTPQYAIGSTMLALADDAGARRSPPIPQDRYLPPYPNRPCFDGDMQTMERLVPELVALTSWMREQVAKNWATSLPENRL